MKTSFQGNFFGKFRVNRNGAALVVVLVLLVLMLGVILAFFSQSILQRQVSKSSASQTAADLLAVGAADTTIGDLRREIQNAANSVASGIPNTSPARNLYRPKSPDKVLPKLVGTAVDLPNLLKRSSGSLAFADGVTTRAAVAPSSKESANGRIISNARWNKPLLMQAKSLADLTPAGGFTSPDWIFVDRQGGNPTSWSANLKWSPNPSVPSAVIGRYAYTIYNEGGLLDANVAGYAQSVNSKIESAGVDLASKFKSSQGYADLTYQNILTSGVIDQLVNWRNLATLKSNPVRSYFNLSLNNPSGFVTTSNIEAANQQSDRMFTSRQQLIDIFMRYLGGGDVLQQALMYFGTFNRSLDQPSYFPDPNRPKVWRGDWVASPGKDINESTGNSAFGKDDEYNPAFRNIRVSNEYTRLNGSKARVGDPLVQTRFPLNRLAWITYKGPSAQHMSDPVVKHMISLMGGDPENPNDPVTLFVSKGTATAIQDYFGLGWSAGKGTDGIGGYWLYSHNFPGRLASLKNLSTEKRDADFFELLKASIVAGSIAYGNDGISTNNSLNPSDPTQAVTTYVNEQATQVDAHIIQIGANIIDQVWPENFPTQIVFDDGFGKSSYWGKVDLPYFYGAVNVGFLVNQAAPPAPDNDSTAYQPLSKIGKITALQVPIIWNPHFNAMPKLDYTSTSDTSPTDLRICVSNLSVAWKELANSAPNSYSYLFYQQESTSKVNAPGGNDFSGQQNSTIWSKGNYDKNTGALTMLGENQSDNTALYFDNAKPGDPLLYREPTLLMRNAGGINLRIDSQNLIVTKGGFTTSGVNEEGQTPQFLGFYIGSCGQRWSVTTGSDPSKWFTYSVTQLKYGDKGTTISLEYKSGGAWIPYFQTITRNGSNVEPSPMAINFKGANYNRSVLDAWRNPSGLPLPNGTLLKRQSFGQFDPRSRRWFGTGEVLVGDFIAGTDRTRVQTYRPVANSQGDGGRNVFLGSPTKDMYQGTEHSNIYCADWVNSARFARRGPGAYVPGGFTGSTTIGMPMAQVEGGTNSDNKYNRPLILHRPFRSVAELGYVFSDTPWKNIDFFTPESGDLALLDTFCIAENTFSDGIVAGKVDLNTRQPKVLGALLRGAIRDELATGAGADAALTEGEAQRISDALISYTSGGKQFASIADLVGGYVAGGSNSAPLPAPYDGFATKLTNLYAAGSTAKESLVQRFREAMVRALSNTTQAGTWNLLIDVIAQTGKYPSNATDLNKFTVEGERRYWVHVAIDRQTGEVVDQQMELVSE